MASRTDEVVEEELGPEDRRVGICRLCLNVRRLCESHIIPEWVYRLLYDERGRCFQLSAESQPRASYRQKGIWEYLLCEECDNGRFGRYDGHAAELIATPGRLTLPLPGRLAENTTDYGLFKLFQMSVLWRAHIASHVMFRPVNLGEKHAERLRRMLLAGDPGPASDYPCVLHATYMNAAPAAVILSPLAYKHEGYHQYGFTFGGFHWLYVVASHDVGHPVLKLALQDDGRFLLTASDFTKTHLGGRVAQEVFFPNVENVDRLRARRSRRQRQALRTENSSTL